MIKTGIMLILALACGVSHAKTRPEKIKVGVLTLSHDPSSGWLAEDEELFSRLANGLESDQVKVLRMKDFESFFHDPPDPKQGALSSSALRHLTEGRKFSTGLKPRLAIEQFTEALRELRAIFPYLKDLRALEEAHLERGMTYQALGNDAWAKREYRMVLLLDPERKLDDAVVSPVVVDSFEKVRKSLLTSLKGSISIISKPSGASLTMDGKVVGTTPITVPGVIPGEHYLSLKHPGYKVWFGVLKVPEGAMEKREVFMVEGKSIKHWRLLRKVSSAGATKADMNVLMTGLGVDQLLLFEFDHVGGKTLLKVTAGLLGQSPMVLGVFPVEGDDFVTLLEKLRRWLAGDRSELLGSTLKTEGKKKEDLQPVPPVVSDSKWYEQWWVWTIAGAVLVGAAATTTAVLLGGGQSGIQVDVYR